MGSGRYVPDSEAREIICTLGARAYQAGLMCSCDGNISVKVADDKLWVTPAGVSKGFLTPDMLVKMDLAGNIIEAGDMRPSSEIKMHLRVYNENSDIQSVFHAHPIYGTVYAIAGKSLDTALLAENVVFLGAIPCAPYATPGTEEVPESVAPFCKEYNGCFLGNHGTLTWGEDAYEAYYRLESLEHACKMDILLNSSLKQINPLTADMVEKLYGLRKAYGYKRGGKMKILD